MPVDVDFRFGEPWDFPADLLVIPSSVRGTVTRAVGLSLRQHRLPQPFHRLRLGEVDFTFLGHARFDYIAFAAAVFRKASSPSVVEGIGRQLGGLTAAYPEIRTVSAPLLGTSGGALSAQSSADALRRGFLETAADGATLVLSVADPEDHALFTRTLTWGSTPGDGGGPPAARAARDGGARPERSHVFISYSHQDVKWLKRLQVHLKPFERSRTVVRWDDTLLKPSRDWREEIRSAISRTRVGVLLVSADFVASDFISTDELPPLVAAARDEGAVILLVIVSPSNYQRIRELKPLQTVNDPKFPLIRLSKFKQELVFTDLATAIANEFEPTGPDES